ncbi:hydroxymethylglutaryl-CoA reductase, degradative [Lacticaseibacillus suibinensis]|uniref:hydroxymethylglutaryl-CoA reductase, degradative n=1 Tax=Lacticaseibacillus suibinensis TaxID=2486011 RepID=UPI001944EE7B|nr:hydroxymethylglutaryl-CoA reductase, degradative [Lacticaseibacillus suibinensis]
MTKFYELTTAERLAQLVADGNLSAEDAALLQQATALPDDVASHLSENQIGQFTLPLGLVRNLPVNGAMRQVAMATEEPSVVAAASNGARLAGLNGGVKATAAPHRVVAEVVFDAVPDLTAAQAVLQAHEAELFQVAQAAHPSIVKRGGGLKQVTTTVVDRFLKLRLVIDPSQAMGANICNTIAEAIAAAAGAWLAQPALVAILTNASAQLTTATVTLAPASLATKHEAGSVIARRIAALSDLAQVDAERAATHNKGIMNGIEAAVLATGNDTRAVAAAVSAYSQGRPLSTWQMVDGQLKGKISLPLPVGVVGGAISALPLAGAALRLGGFQTVAALQEALAALGLVQNLAALRALAGPGIQAGHMALQANALAMAAGAQGEEITQVAAALQGERKELAVAKQLLTQLRTKAGKNQ